MSDLIPDDLRLQPGYFPNTPFDAPHNQYVSVARFREDMPAFKDDTVYMNQSVQFYLDIAGIIASPKYWCQFTVFGHELIAAHFLALQQYYQRSAAASAGGGQVIVPGMPMGLMQSKSVSKVSVSYDYSAMTMDGWGPWNATSFGQQFAFLAQMVGTGGIEMLSVGFAGSQAGRITSTNAHGVLWGYYGSTG